MELSESVQRGLQSLADPSLFDLNSFPVLVDVSFRSLLSSHADSGILGELFCPSRCFPLLPVCLRADVKELASKVVHFHGAMGTRASPGVALNLSTSVFIAN